MHSILARSLHPSAAAARPVAELRRWYASHSVVRRLWAIQEADAIRIVLTLEPTVDGSDTQPAWLANSSAWKEELQLRMRTLVRLQMLDEPSLIAEAITESSVLITQLSWRDLCVLDDCELGAEDEEAPLRGKAQ